ncbi:MAG: hypothetical protein ACERKD_13795 [Prolixibacteraceae bacterium]
MLKKRTLDITDKIRRNIRIGIGIVLAWACLGFAIDFLLTPILETKLDKPYLTDELMFWSFILEAFNYVLIFTAIIVFWIRYNKIEKENIDITNLRSKLKGLIGVLNSYKRMFYIIMALIIVYVIVAFSSGFFMEYNHLVNSSSFDLHNLKLTAWIITILLFLIFLGGLVAVYYLLFTLFFKRLYGRYLKQLKLTLQELEESPAIK